MEYIGLIIYYAFSLWFMIGYTDWENFSIWGGILYGITILVPFCWALFPLFLGEMVVKLTDKWNI